MSQSIEYKAVTSPAVKSSPRNVAIAYVVLVLTPVVLKLLGFTRIAVWSWSKVTVTLWAPWALTLVCSILGWIVYKVQNRRG